MDRGGAGPLEGQRTRCRAHLTHGMTELRFVWDFVLYKKMINNRKTEEQSAGANRILSAHRTGAHLGPRKIDGSRPP
jgi:hypothetical protein